MTNRLHLLKQPYRDIDAEKWTFPQIADLIESVPVGLWRDECFESGRQPEDNSDG